MSRTYRKLRDRDLIVGNRLRVELLIPQSPHAREWGRQDLQAATNRAQRRCSHQPPRSQTHTSATPLDSDTLHKKQEPLSDPPLPGAQQRAQQKRKSRRKTQPRTPQPSRVSAPEFLELAALTVTANWGGPSLDDTAIVAQRHGWQPAVAAILEVEYRQQRSQRTIRYPKALVRTVALCYANRCAPSTGHSGPCGDVARRLHAARRADDLDYRRRVIAAKRSHDAASPIRLRAMPAPQPPAADPRIALLRRIIAEMEAKTITRDDALGMVDAAGLGGLLQAAMRKPADPDAGGEPTPSG